MMIARLNIHAQATQTIVQPLLLLLSCLRACTQELESNVTGVNGIPGTGIQDKGPEV